MIAEPTVSSHSVREPEPRPVQLHSTGVHYGMRVLSLVPPMMVAYMVVLAGIQSELPTISDLRELTRNEVVGALFALTFFSLFLWAVLGTSWRTYQVFAHRTHLEVRRGKKRRRIEFGDIRGLERPLYDRSRLFGSIEIQLRQGDSIYFQATPGAEEYLRVRAGLPPVSA